MTGRSRRASGSASSGPNGAGKTTLLRMVVRPRRARPRRPSSRKRGLSLGLLGQEAHFDEAFMAAPDLRAAVRHGAAHLERMAEELGGARARRPGRPTPPTRTLQHRFDVLGGYTLDQRVDEALSGLGFARDEWLARRRRCRAASRRGPRSRGS